MNKNIWIVEDELAIAQPLIYSLDVEGFQVRHFDRAQSLLDALRNKSEPPTVDFLVLDVGLPDIDGFALWRQIKDQHDIPMLFLTARSDEIDRVLGLEMGADDYVTKPFSPREVCTRIRNILKRIDKFQKIKPHSVGAQKYETDFMIKADEARIYYGTHALSLTRYEYRLLKLLIEHPLRVYSRAQLMDHVWVEQEESLERTVDTHIKTLRAKLKAIDAECTAIITHRGFGYSLRQI